MRLDASVISNDCKVIEEIEKKGFKQVCKPKKFADFCVRDFFCYIACVNFQQFNHLIIFIYHRISSNMYKNIILTIFSILILIECVCSAQNVEGK